MIFLRVNAASFFFLFIINCVSSQEGVTPKFIFAHDLYGITFKIKKILLSSECDYCTEPPHYQDEENCHLVEADIISCFWHVDSTVYSDKEELLSVPHLILYCQTDWVLDSTYSGLANNSCSKNLLLVHRLVSEAQKKDLDDQKGFPYFSGLVKRYKYNFLQRIFMFLGINRKKIQRNGKLIDPNKTKFIKFINDHYSNDSDS